MDSTLNDMNFVNFIVLVVIYWIEISDNRRSRKTNQRTGND